MWAHARGVAVVREKESWCAAETDGAGLVKRGGGGRGWGKNRVMKIGRKFQLMEL